MNSLHRSPVLYCLAGVLLALIPVVRKEFIGLFLLIIPIFAFAFFAYHHKEDEPATTESEIGDNCYLIGFIFTLSVITISLISGGPELAGIGGEEARKELLTTIGIALGTSVAGMVLRMFFHNIAMDKFTQLDDTLSKVTDQAWQLKQVFDELNKSTREANSEIHNYVYTLKLETEKLLSEFMESLSNIPGTIDDRFKQTMDDIFTKIEADLDEIFTKHLEATAKIGRESLSEFRELINEAQKVKAGLKSLSGGLGAVSIALDKMLENIGELSSKMPEISNLAEANEKNAETMKETSAEIEQVLKGHIKTMKDTLTGIGNVLQEHLNTITELEGNLKEHYGNTVKLAEEESSKLYSRLLALAENNSAKEDSSQPGPKQD